MTRCLARSAVVGLAIAAFGASTALAVPSDLRSPSAINAHGAVEPKQDLRSPDARDAGEGRGTFTAPDVMIVKVPGSVQTDGGIDWADVGIGAGGLLGLTLIGLGGSLAVVHRRQARATPGI